MPFVQGRLREKAFSAIIETRCADSTDPIRIELDSDLNYSIPENEVAPLVFVPRVDFSKLKAPNIIDAF